MAHPSHSVTKKFIDWLAEVKPGYEIKSEQYFYSVQNTQESKLKNRLQVG